MNNLDYEIMNYWTNTTHKDYTTPPVKSNSSLENFSIKDLISTKNINYYKY